MVEMEIMLDTNILGRLANKQDLKYHDTKNAIDVFS
jgi:hypothetical protein